MTFDTNTTATNGSESSNAMDEGYGEVGRARGVQYVALRHLCLSTENVRKTEPTHITELAAMIEAQGLLAALHVTREVDEVGQVTGRYAVHAGGRRYRALMLLQSRGKLSLDSLIECKLVQAGEGLEVSLAENLGQEPMHPADEYAAFQGLIDAGKSIEQVSIAFGVTQLHVKRRLKLASVAPSVLAVFRAGEMSLDVLMAFASNDDQERQEAVWAGLGTWERNNAHLIRNRLDEEEIEQDDPRVKAIGLQNYLDAGGTLKEDLFADDNHAPPLVDVGLVDLLVGELMQPAVEAVSAEGWAWVRVFSQYGWEQKNAFTQMPVQYRQATPEEQAQRQALQAMRLERVEQLDALYEMDDDSEADTEGMGQALEREIEAIEAQEAALERELVDGDSFDKTQSGAIVALLPTGVEIYRGMVERKAAHSSGGGDSPSKAVPVKPEIPESLMKNLTSHLTAATQAQMLTNQSVSLAALAGALAHSIFSGYGATCPVQVRASTFESAMKTNSDTFATSKAGLILAQQKELWLSQMPDDKGLWFAWFLKQTQETVLAFLVYASAVSTDLIRGTDKANPLGDCLVEALGLDMGQWWQATPETYFNLVPKSKLSAVLMDVGDETGANELGKMKKIEAVVHTAEHLTGKNWLPRPLRTQAVAGD